MPNRFWNISANKDTMPLQPVLNPHNKEEHKPSHTAEHLLNQVMVRMFGCERSRNAHIERKKSKINYTLDHEPTPQQIEDIERQMNQLIAQDLPVTYEYVTRQSIPEGVTLDKLPQDASETIRIVRIGDFDICPCIGQHVSSTGEIILTIDPSNTEIIDAQTGLPVELSEVQNGSFEAYLGDAMTMSLPPQCTPDMVIVNIAEDEAAPQYAEAAKDPVDSTDLENAIVLEATDGRTYLIDKDAQVTPYLTKNIVKLQDLTAGTSCLLWEDENGIVTKVMIFA